MIPGAFIPSESFASTDFRSIGPQQAFLDRLLTLTESQRAGASGEDRGKCLRKDFRDIHSLVLTVEFFPSLFRNMNAFNALIFRPWSDYNVHFL